MSADVSAPPTEVPIVRGLSVLVAFVIGIVVHIVAWAISAHLAWPMGPWAWVLTIGVVIPLLPFLVQGSRLSLIRSTTGPLVVWVALGLLLLPFVWLVDFAILLWLVQSGRGSFHI